MSTTTMITSTIDDTTEGVLITPTARDRHTADTFTTDVLRVATGTEEEPDHCSGLYRAARAVARAVLAGERPDDGDTGYLGLRVRSVHPGDAEELVEGASRKRVQPGIWTVRVGDAAVTAVRATGGGWAATMDRHHGDVRAQVWGRTITDATTACLALAMWPETSDPAAVLREAIKLRPLAFGETLLARDGSVRRDGDTAELVRDGEVVARAYATTSGRVVVLPGEASQIGADHSPAGAVAMAARLLCEAR